MVASCHSGLSPARTAVSDNSHMLQHLKLLSWSRICMLGSGFEPVQQLDLSHAHLHTALSYLAYT